MEQHLNRLWKSILKLEYDCRIDFSKLESIPELDIHNESIVIDRISRSMIFKRIKLFKSLERYNALLDMANCLECIVKRDNDGCHKIILK